LQGRVTNECGYGHAAQVGGVGDLVFVLGIQAQIETGGGGHGLVSFVYGSIPYEDD
jgi:hypothetical protein